MLVVTILEKKMQKILTKILLKLTCLKNNTNWLWMNIIGSHGFIINKFLLQNLSWDFFGFTFPTTEYNDIKKGKEKFEKPFEKYKIGHWSKKYSLFAPIWYMKFKVNTNPTLLPNYHRIMCLK